MHYYQHNIGDYRKDTGHLSLLEHGVYRQLLDWFYLDEKPIPADTEVVMRRLQARTDEEKKAVTIVLSEFFSTEKSSDFAVTGYTQNRATAEIRAYNAKAQRARENGKLGGKPSVTKVVKSGLENKTDDKPTSKLTNNHKPITINQEPYVKPKGLTRTKKSNDLSVDWVQILQEHGVSEEVAAEYLTVREEKKKPMTGLALKRAITEAGKAGITLGEALEVAAAKGWQGFEATYYANLHGGGKHGDASPPRYAGRLTGEALEAHNSAVGDAWVAKKMKEFENAPV